MAPCLIETDGYQTEGSLFIGEGVGDAAQVSAVAWESHAGCERVEIGFLTNSGAPASAVGRSSASWLPAAGVVRIEFPESVVESGPTDVTADSRFVRATYVVWTREGRLAADIHLKGEQAVEVRPDIETSPARALLDVRPAAEGAVVMAPIVGDELVVISPSGGATAYPLRITGYTRPAGAAVDITFSVNGEVEQERRTISAGQEASWGEFSIVIDDGPTGAAEVIVTSESAPDDGIAIPVEIG